MKVVVFAGNVHFMEFCEKVTLNLSHAFKKILKSF